MYMGIDIGSISAKLAIVSEGGTLLFSRYRYHRGKPADSAIEMLMAARQRGFDRYLSLCVTGSGRRAIGAALEADLVKNEITASWKAAVSTLPDARTIIEMGGQDSKLITLEDGEIEDFKLNSVCAAGTGSFIEQQAGRLGVSLRRLSSLAKAARKNARFTGRCTVFVETEMINLQQRGFPVEALAAGLFDAVCENFFNDLGPGMKVESPILFYGGVSEIAAVRTSFERLLGKPVIVPAKNKIMAAYGAALLAAESHKKRRGRGKRIASLPPKLRTAAGLNPARCRYSDCLDCGLCSWRGAERKSGRRGTPLK